MALFAFETHPLVRYLRDPESAVAFAAPEWEQLISAARRGYLLSRVAWLAKRDQFFEQLPQKIQLHLQSASRVAESQTNSVNREIVHIHQALAEPAIPFTLLKGAAYIKGRFDTAQGRLLSDIDILVPKDRLTDAEITLCKHGWFPTKLDAYDQRYYREWMHELPPLQHLGRGTTLDVHHTILPPTARLKPDVGKLWSDVCAVEKAKDIFVLSPVDMVLHSATHLFHDGELEHGLRDLVDLDALIGQFSMEHQFFEKLISRAEALDLGRPLYYALKYCRAFLSTSIPDAVFLRASAYDNRSVVVRSIIEFAILKSIGSVLEDRPSFAAHASQFVMYVRSHYLRMPLRLLLPHLLRKQFLAVN